MSGNMKPASSKYKQSKTPFEYIVQRTMIPHDGSTDCWIWIGGKDRDGYGQCHAAKVTKDNKVTRAHQLAWVMLNGPIPADMLVCHTCDNPSCVNPNHLFLGTWDDNVQDMVSKGRHRNGAKPNPNTKAILDLHGKESCFKVAERFGVSYSRVCQIWRAHGKTSKK